MKALIDLAQTLLQGLVTWFFAITSPVETTTELLAQDPIQRRASTSILLLWSVILTLAITSPLSHLYGIELGTIGFYALQIIITFLSFVFGLWCIHVALRILGLSSNLPDIFVIYTCTFLVYWPIYQAVMLPSQADQYRMVSTLKAGGTSDLGAAFNSVVQSIVLQKASDTSASQVLQTGILQRFPVISAIIFITGLLIWLIQLTLFGEFVTQWFSNDRFRTFLAVSLGSFVFSLGTLITLIPLSMFVLWSYIK